MIGNYLHIGIEFQRTLLGHLRFTFTHVLLMEQELPVEIAYINGVQVDLEIEYRRVIHNHR